MLTTDGRGSPVGQFEDLEDLGTVHAPTPVFWNTVVASSETATRCLSHQPQDEKSIKHLELHQISLQNCIVCTSNS